MKFLQVVFLSVFCLLGGDTVHGMNYWNGEKIVFGTPGRQLPKKVQPVQSPIQTTQTSSAGLSEELLETLGSVEAAQNDKRVQDWLQNSDRLDLPNPTQLAQQKQKNHVMVAQLLRQVTVPQLEILNIGTPSKSDVTVLQNYAKKLENVLQNLKTIPGLAKSLTDKLNDFIFDCLTINQSAVIRMTSKEPIDEGTIAVVDYALTGMQNLMFDITKAFGEEEIVTAIYNFAQKTKGYVAQQSLNAEDQEDVLDDDDDGSEASLSSQNSFKGAVSQQDYLAIANCIRNVNIPDMQKLKSKSSDTRKIEIKYYNDSLLSIVTNDLSKIGDQELGIAVMKFIKACCNFNDFIIRGNFDAAFSKIGLSLYQQNVTRFKTECLDALKIIDDKQVEWAKIEIMMTVFNELALIYENIIRSHQKH